MATEISVKIILDSISPEGKRLTTMHWRYPRFIHSEVMTHRLFSRNARSSRAVPGKTLIAELLNGAAVVPLHWGKNQRGMQAFEEMPHVVEYVIKGEDGVDRSFFARREQFWESALNDAVTYAQRYESMGFHKQVYNRLLEPFLHIDTLVTATDFANFIWLRDHKDAEPHIKILAQKVKEAMDASTPTLLQPGQWHLPYITAEDWKAVALNLVGDDHGRLVTEFEVLPFLKQISAARCARISYKPFDGNASIEAELNRYQLLVSSDRVHASPVEHQATPDQQSYMRVQVQRDPSRANPDDNWETVEEGMRWNYPQLHGNFTGWIQFRKTIPNEAIW